MSTRIRGVLALAAGGAVCALAACSGLPDGVDGDLVGGWEPLPEPTSFVPEAGVCHPDPFAPEAPLVEYQPVPCDEPHMVETVHVGSVDTDRDSPPGNDTQVHREAYGECEEQVADHLGADFRDGRLWLGVAFPSEEGWDGGARWFRCDLVEVASVYGDAVERESSLAGALSDDGEPALQLGCFEVTTTDNGGVDEMTPTGCDEPHQAEYVGSWEASDGSHPDPDDGQAEDRVYDGCREQVAEYTDVPVDGDLQYRSGTIADWMSESEWHGGDHAFRCYVWLPDEELTESLAGAGTDALPVRTE